MTFYPTIPTVLKDGTELPQYAHEGDAGLDLCATEDVTLRPQEWKMVGSGISMAIPKGFVGLVVPRSGMGCKGLVLKNTIGVIDSTYRGEIKVPLFNNNPTHIWYDGPSDSDRELLRSALGVYGSMLGDMVNDEVPCLIENSEGTIHIHKGDRVAQLLIVPVTQAILVQTDTLEESERGEGGFGSTGVRL